MKNEIYNEYAEKVKLLKAQFNENTPTLFLEYFKIFERNHDDMEDMLMHIKLLNQLQNYIITIAQYWEKALRRS